MQREDLLGEAEGEGVEVPGSRVRFLWSVEPWSLLWNPGVSSFTFMVGEQELGTRWRLPQSGRLLQEVVSSL